MTTATRALDRHALVMAVWLAAGLVAATSFHYGINMGGGGFIVAAFGVILAAFIGHIVVNAVFDTLFTPRELALGLVLYVVALLSFGAATLVLPGFAARAFLPGSAGFVTIFAAVIFHMVTSNGVRGAFEAFDVVRSFKAPPGRAASDMKKGAA